MRLSMSSYYLHSHVRVSHCEKRITDASRSWPLLGLSKPAVDSGMCGLSKGCRANLSQAITTLFQPSPKRFREIGIIPATHHRLEMAEQNVTLKTLEQLVGRLKCSISDVFSESEPIGSVA